jgi:hypothetical protein
LSVAIEVTWRAAHDLTLAFDARALRVRDDAARTPCVLVDLAVAVIVDPIAELQAAFQTGGRDAGVARARGSVAEAVERAAVARSRLVCSALRVRLTGIVTVATRGERIRDDQGEEAAAARGVHDDHVVWLRSKVSREDQTALEGSRADARVFSTRRRLGVAREREVQRDARADHGGCRKRIAQRGVDLDLRAQV